MRGLYVCLLFTTVIAFGQGRNQPQEERNRPLYKLFAAIEPEQIEKRLNKYAADFYRLSAIAGGGEDTTLVIMSAIPPEAVTFKYKVIRSSLLTLDSRFKPKETSILDLMNAAGAEGYRLVMDSVVEYDPPFMPNYAQDFNRNYVPRGFSVIMERKSDESGHYDYRIFAPVQLSGKPSFEDLTKNYQKAHQDGFLTVYLGGGTIHPYVLVSQREVAQRLSERTEVETDHFSVVQFKELFPEIEKEADAGYAVRFHSVFRQAPGLLNPGAGPVRVNLCSQKASDGPLKPVLFEGKMPQSFEEFGSFKTEFQSKLNSSADGLCVAGALIEFARRPSQFSNYLLGLGTTMKPCPAGGKAVYRFALGKTPPDLAESINKLASEGYSLVPESFDFVSVLMKKVN